MNIETPHRPGPEKVAGFSILGGFAAPGAFKRSDVIRKTGWAALLFATNYLQSHERGKGLFIPRPIDLLGRPKPQKTHEKAGL